MLRVLLELHAVYADARSWLSAKGAICLVCVVGICQAWSARAAVRQYLLTFRERPRQGGRLLVIAIALLTILTLLVVSAAMVAKYRTEPAASPQVHAAMFTTNWGTCEAQQSQESGDIQIASDGGPCTATQSDPLVNTVATPNTYTANHDVRQRKSTPGTGMKIVGEDGTSRFLLARQRGWLDGTWWCLDVMEYYLPSGSSVPETLTLKKKAHCVNLPQRPDRVRMTIRYDGELFQIVTDFIFDMSGNPLSTDNHRIVKIPHSRPRARKYLAVISTVGQEAEDLLPIKTVLPIYWWQRDVAP